MGGLNNLIAQLRLCTFRSVLSLKGFIIPSNFNDLLQKVIHFYCIFYCCVHLKKQNKKKTLCFINALKHRGLQNELFMHIQIRLCPLIRIKARSLVVCCQEEQKQEITGVLERWAARTFLTYFYCQASVLHPAKTA